MPSCLRLIVMISISRYNDMATRVIGKHINLLPRIYIWLASKAKKINVLLQIIFHKHVCTLNWFTCLVGNTWPGQMRLHAIWQQVRLQCHSRTFLRRCKNSLNPEVSNMYISSIFSSESHSLQLQLKKDNRIQIYCLEKEVRICSIK